jgi:hypothetical protein
MERKDQGRADELEQVGRRIKHGSSMVTRMTPMKRVARLKRQRRRLRPMA